MLRTLLTCTAVLAAAAAARAADPAPELKLVPADGAVFAHVDVARLWGGKIGETFRKANAPDLDKLLKEVKAVSGLTPDDVNTFTFFVPAAKDDGQPPFGMLVGTKKPYDRAKVVAFFKEKAGKGKDAWVEKGDHKFMMNERVMLDLSDTKSFRVYNFLAKNKMPPAPSVNGPLAPAIKLAAEGKPAILSVAFANLPDEIRGENIPAEVKPFQPIFHTDTGTLVADFVKDRLAFDLRFAAPSRAKGVEAEKSIGALKTLVDAALGLALGELSKDKSYGLRFVDFVKEVRESVRAATITNDGNPALALAVKSDLDFAPFLEFTFGKVGTAQGRMMEQNNMKQIGLAMHNYLSTYNTFPPSAVVGKKGKPLLSWRVMVLPYVEQDELYKKFKLDEPWDSAHNKKVFDENPMPAVFFANNGTAKQADKKTHYQVFTGNGAMFDLVQGAKIFDITDGTSNTLMVATAKTPVPWTKPDDIEFDPKADPREVLLFVNDVCNIGFADGSVRAVSNKATADVLRAIITKAGGEVVELP